MGSPFQVRKRLKRQAKRAAHIAFRLVFSRGSDDSDVVDVSQTPSPPTAPPVEKRADTTPAKGSPVDDIQPVAEDIAPAPKKSAPKKPAAKKPAAKKRKTSTTSKAKTASSAKSKSTKAKAAAATKAKSKSKAKSKPSKSKGEEKKAKSDSEKPSDPAPSKEEQAAQRQKAHWEKTRLGVLGFVAENGGTASLREMHDFERKYFIAHQSFSRLMEELTDADLLAFDFDTGMATLTDAGRSKVN